MAIQVDTYGGVRNQLKAIVRHNASMSLLRQNGVMCWTKSLTIQNIFRNEFKVEAHRITGAADFSKAVRRMLSGYHGIIT
jgi:esterase/lipase superfamily enzyme